MAPAMTASSRRRAAYPGHVRFSIGFAPGRSQQFRHYRSRAGEVTGGCWGHQATCDNKEIDDHDNECADEEKVEVSSGYNPGQRNKNLLTIAAEAQAKSGHDILAMPSWGLLAHAEQLEPVN